MVLSAKQILSSIPNITTEGIREDKKTRHPAHEFQAFAYKIAADFNDLVNLKLYLNLLKRVDRIIIEQAYSFAIDSRAADKKKSFLWKIKKLRDDLRLHLLNNNFDYANILKRMKAFRDKYAESTILKYSHGNSFFEFIVSGLKRSTYKKVLIIGFPSVELVLILSKLSTNIYYYDYSKIVRRKFLSKDCFKGLNLHELAWADPQKLPKRTSKFDLIVSEGLFQVFPLGLESEFFDLLKKLSGENLELFLNLSSGDVSTQEWRPLANTNDYFFYKKFAKKELLKTVTKYFKIFNFEEYDQFTLYHLTNL